MQFIFFSKFFSVQVLDLEIDGQRVGRGDAKDLCKEVELAFNVGNDVLRLPEAVLLALKQHVSDREALLLHRVVHHLRLVWGNNGILITLEEDDRAVQALNMVDRGAVEVHLLVLRVLADEPVEVTGLELVCVHDQGLQVADTVVAAPGLEDLAEGQHRQGRETSSASTLLFMFGC